MNRTVAGLVVLVCVSFFGEMASAQRVEAASASSDESADARARALELYGRSRERYDVGDYEAAAALLREAYDLHPEPNLLYNLARAYGNLGRFEEAIDAYEQFLEAAPETGDRQVIEARIENYRIALAERRAEQQRREAARRALEPEPRPPVAVEPRSPEPAPWIIAGAGGGVVVAGAVFGGMSALARSDAAQESSFVPAREASDRAVAFAWVANAAFALGGALVALGVVWGIVDVATAPEGGDSEERSDVALVAGPNGVGLAW